MFEIWLVIQISFSKHSGNTLVKTPESTGKSECIVLTKICILIDPGKHKTTFHRFRRTPLQCGFQHRQSGEGLRQNTQKKYICNYQIDKCANSSFDAF